MPKLFMLLVGCRPAGRHTEQHDIFFGIGEHIKDILPAAAAFWPEAKSSFHLDAWREVTKINDVVVRITESATRKSRLRLFFINLGGYKPGEFEEFHYKMLVTATDKNDAIKQSKQTAFFRHTGFKNATAHIDDKYGIDVDDLFLVKDILPADLKSKYHIVLEPATADDNEDLIHLGYFQPAKADKWAPVNGQEGKI